MRILYYTDTYEAEELGYEVNVTIKVKDHTTFNSTESDCEIVEEKFTPESTDDYSTEEFERFLKSNKDKMIKLAFENCPIDAEEYEFICE